MEQSGEAQREAQVLAQNDFFRGAVSRLYYSVFYVVRALLLSEGLQPKSHEGMSVLLGRHFIREGILPRRLAHIFSRLMKYREEADHNPSYVFTREDFERFQAEADEVHAAILVYLTERGYGSKQEY